MAKNTSVTEVTFNGQDFLSLSRKNIMNPTWLSPFGRLLLAHSNSLIDIDVRSNAGTTIEFGVGRINVATF